MESSKRRLTAQIITFCFVVFMLAVPLIVYVAKFGAEISANHQRWSEMGSAMSGIYTPILSLLTLFVLFRQVKLQQDLNLHEYDQAYLLVNRADLEYYLGQLDRVLGETLSNGATAREVLKAEFEREAVIFDPESGEYSRNYLRGVARQFYTECPNIFSLWSAICGILGGLEAGGRSPYSLYFKTSQQKITGMIAFETCIALDHFKWAISEDNAASSYFFSPVLTSKERRQ